MSDQHEPIGGQSAHHRGPTRHAARLHYVAHRAQKLYRQAVRDQAALAASKVSRSRGKATCQSAPSHRPVQHGRDALVAAPLHTRISRKVGRPRRNTPVFRQRLSRHPAARSFWVCLYFVIFCVKSKIIKVYCKVIFTFLLVKTKPISRRRMCPQFLFSRISLPRRPPTRISFLTSN